jgi:hypothetical protein
MIGSVTNEQKERLFFRTRTLLSRSSAKRQNKRTSGISSSHFGRQHKLTDAGPRDGGWAEFFCVNPVVRFDLNSFFSTASGWIKAPEQNFGRDQPVHANFSAPRQLPY